MEEQKISIKNVLYNIFSKWRSIVVVTLLVTLGFTMGKYWVDLRNYNNAIATISQDTEDEELVTLSVDEQEAVNNVLSTQKELNTYLDYKKSSIIMQIDPYNEDRITLQYHITGSDTIIESIKGYCDSDGLAQSVAAILANGWDAKYVSELISFATLDVSQNNNYIVPENVKSDRVFNVSVIGPDTDTTASIADATEDAIEGYVNEKTDIFGDVTLNLIDRTQTVIINSSLLSRQSDVTSNIIALQNSITDMKSALSEEQIQLLNSNSDTTMEEDTDVEVVAPQKPAIGKKVIVLGILIGLFVICFIYAVMYMMSNKMKNAEDLFDTYRLPMMGRVISSVKKNPIDRFIQKMDVPKDIPLEAQIQSVQQMLTYQCRGHEITKLAFVSSTDMKSVDADNIRAIEESLAMRGIDMLFVDHFFTNGDALEKLASYKNVVLVEKIGYSNVMDIAKEVELVQGMKQNILGYIVL